MGLDPGAIQAVSAASGVWRADGRLQGFYRSKLTRSQVQHDSGLIQARRNTQRWNENVKLELQHLAVATPAGTSLVAIQRHVAVTLATWDAVWGEYLHPKWAEQRMRLHGAQEKVLERYFKKLEEAASVSQQEWGTRKQLVVFFGNAGIGTRGGWGPKAVLQACRKVVERANSGKPTDRVPGRVVTVDEFRTSRVSSILNSPQPCEEELDSSKPTRPEDWKPKPGGHTEEGFMGKGKEYPALGFKKLQDRAPKAQAQQPVAQPSKAQTSCHPSTCIVPRRFSADLPQARSWECRRFTFSEGLSSGFGSTMPDAAEGAGVTEVEEGGRGAAAAPVQPASSAAQTRGPDAMREASASACEGADVEDDDGEGERKVVYNTAGTEVIGVWSRGNVPSVWVGSHQGCDRG
ncbi:hypothetical protein QJQ45_025959 [Haematococcus lacustris]|nr:hypothetical protein QJQ45_025959 [Haematococcus lacustris]